MVHEDILQLTECAIGGPVHFPVKKTNVIRGNRHSLAKAH